MSASRSRKGPDMAEMPTGQLIKLHRVDRKMGVVTVATHAGISARYLEMIEAGTKTPSIPALRRIAKVLGIRTSALMSDSPSESNEGPIGAQLAATEKALYTFRTMSLADGALVYEPAELPGRIQAMRHSWFMSPTKFSDVLGVLPDLIVSVEHFVHSSGRSPDACRQACEVYHVARALLKHAGRADLGTLVADRIMRYAEETDDPTLIGLATWNISQAMLTGDMPEGSIELATHGIEKLEPLLAEATPELFSVYGGLLLNTSIGAARTGDPFRAREILRGPAMRAAGIVGDGKNHLGLVFGPTNVAIHRVSLAAEAGEASDVIRFADDVDVKKIPSLERRTTYLYQVARSYEQKNNDMAVLVHLRMAQRECPQDFLYKRNLQGMVNTLVRRARPSFAPEVREFAASIDAI